jgi:hypothetical protein
MAGFVITDILGKSIRIWPLADFTNCEASCVEGAPGAAGCIIVIQLATDGGFGSAMATA